jgi:hypothetical protein
MKNLIYSGQVFYFTNPFEAKGESFFLVGENLEEIKKKAREYAEYYAENNGIDFQKMQIALKKTTIEVMESLLSYARTGRVDSAPIKFSFAKNLMNREKIPLRIGDTVYNL